MISAQPVAESGTCSGFTDYGRAADATATVNVRVPARSDLRKPGRHRDGALRRNPDACVCFGGFCWRDACPK